MSKTAQVEHCLKVKYVKICRTLYESKVRKSACRTLFESKVHEGVCRTLFEKKVKCMSNTV